MTHPIIRIILIFLGLAAKSECFYPHTLDIVEWKNYPYVVKVSGTQRGPCLGVMLSETSFLTEVSCLERDGGFPVIKRLNITFTCHTGKQLFLSVDCYAEYSKIDQRGLIRLHIKEALKCPIYRPCMAIKEGYTEGTCHSFVMVQNQLAIHKLWSVERKYWDYGIRDYFVTPRNWFDHRDKGGIFTCQTTNDHYYKMYGLSGFFRDEKLWIYDISRHFLEPFFKSSIYCTMINIPT